MSEIIGLPFSANLFKFIAQNFLQNPHNISRIDKSIIILPSRGDLLTLKEEFLNLSPSKACFLPRIIAYTDIPEYLILFAPFCPDLLLSLPKTIDNFSLELIILELIEESKKLYPHYNTFEDKEAAEQLKNFLTEFCIYNTKIPNSLKKVSEYEFLTHLLTKFLVKLQSLNAKTEEQLRNLAVERIATTWKNNNLDIDIYAVLPATDHPYILKFLKLINNYPKAKIFIQGIEPSTISKILSKDNTPSSSFYFINKFLKYLGNPNISFPSLIPDTSNQSCILLECINNIEEAQQVALSVVSHLQQGYKKIAIVNDNKTFSKLIKEELKTYNIEVKYLGTDNIFVTKEISFFLLLLKISLNQTVNKIQLLSLLKHELIYLDRRLIEQFEISFLRKPISNLTFQKLSSEIISHDDHSQLLKCFELLIEFQNNLERKNEFSSFLKLHLLTFKKFIKKTSIVEEAKMTIIENLLLETKTAYCAHYHINKEEYFSILLKLLAQNNINSEEYIEEVQLFTLSTARYKNFDLVFICNLNENYFPKIKKSWPPIDTTLIKQLNFPNYQINLGFSAFDFHSLISHPRVVFTRSLQDMGRETLESRFLTEFKLSKSVPKIKYKSIDELQKIPYLPYPRPMARPKLEYRPTTFSVSAIECLINDPYIYYLKYILKLQPLEELEANLTRRNFGIYLHQTISESVNAITDFNTFKDYFLSKFNTILRSEGYLEDVNVRFWLKRINKILPWLYNYEISLKENCKESFTEKYFECLFPVSQATIKLKAIFDRIIIYNDNTAKIIDYKTGNCPSQREVDLGISPQFPLENLILLTCFPLHLKEIMQEYVELKGKKDVANIKEIQVDVLSTKRNLTTLLEKLLNPENSYFPLTNLDANNKYQNFAHIIRLEEWFE